MNIHRLVLQLMKNTVIATPIAHALTIPKTAFTQRGGKRVCKDVPAN